MCQDAADACIDHTDFVADGNDELHLVLASGPHGYQALSLECAVRRGNNLRMRPEILFSNHQMIYRVRTLMQISRCRGINESQ